MSRGERGRERRPCETRRNKFHAMGTCARARVVASRTREARDLSPRRGISATRATRGTGPYWRGRSKVVAGTVTAAAAAAAARRCRCRVIRVTRARE